MRRISFCDNFVFVRQKACGVAMHLPRRTIKREPEPGSSNIVCHEHFGSPVETRPDLTGPRNFGSHQIEQILFTFRSEACGLVEGARRAVSKLHRDSKHPHGLSIVK